MRILSVIMGDDYQNLTRVCLTTKLTYQDLSFRRWRDEIYKIKEICHLEKGKQIDTTLLNDGNLYEYINSEIKESGYCNMYNTEGEAVLVSTFQEMELNLNENSEELLS